MEAKGLKGRERSENLPGLDYELEWLGAGYELVAGLDEVGRGCWAGPVVAGAVVLPLRERALCLNLRAMGVNDSKRLSPRQREALVAVIEEVALGWGIGEATATEVDAIGIARASRLAMERALAQLPCHVEALLLDAFPLPEVALPQRSIVRGDRFSLSIAAASVLAKVYRDRLMVALEQAYPGYGFASHKGYGTAQHQQALQNLGATPLHRMSWGPLQGYQLPLPLGE
jgi:ribonuclease HII